MDLASGDPRPQRLDACVLRATHDLVHLLDIGRWLALRHGARHIGPVPRLLVLREDVHDDRLALVQRSRAHHVRVRALRTWGDDRAVRRVAELEEAALDDRSQPFCGERRAVELKHAFLANGRAAQCIDASRPGVFAGALRRLERLDLVGPLRAPAVAEVEPNSRLDAERSQSLGHADREVRRDGDALRPARCEEARDDVRIHLLARHALGHEVLPAELVDVEHRRRARLLAHTALLERDRDDHNLVAILERDDRIGREEARQVVDIRELVPVGVEEERRAVGPTHPGQSTAATAMAAGRRGDRPVGH